MTCTCLIGPTNILECKTEHRWLQTFQWWYASIHNGEFP